MTSKTFLTVAEAAVRVNKSRQTLFDKIKRGQLSATVNHDGVKVVEVSELLRVFGSLLSDDEVQQNQANKTRQPALTTQTSTLQLELERAKLQIERRDFELEQLRSRLDEMRERERTATEERLRLFGIIERQSLLLSAPKAVTKTQKSSVAPTAKTPVKPTTGPKSVTKAVTKTPKPPVKSLAKSPVKPTTGPKSATTAATKTLKSPIKSSVKVTRTRV